MKLIDLLVQELPKRGGWPEGVTALCQGHDGRLEKIEEGDSFDTDIFIEPLIKGHRQWASSLAECDAEIVTREQYLAASQEPVWSGDGLPPVGTECEFFNEDYDVRDSVPKNGTVVKIVSHDRTSAGFDVAVFTWPGEKGGLHAEVCTEMLFRPIRTESERKRQVAVDQMAMHCTPGEIYDAIASGQITGVKLESS